MGTAENIAREQEAGLALLFQRGLELALRVQEDAMAAETADERARLAGAFHRIARGVRQTAALQSRLAGDARRAEREDRREVVRLDEHRLARRKAQVKATLERQIWTEAESGEAESMIDDLETFLGEDDLYGRLAEGDVDTHIARLRQELGLSPAAAPSGVPAADPAPTAVALTAEAAERPRPAPVMPDHPFQSSG